MRFELTDQIGKFAVLVLTGTVAIKIWSTQLSRGAIINLLKWIAAIVVGVWLIGLLPKRPGPGLDLGNCVPSGNWTNCSGWPIFSETLGSATTAVGNKPDYFWSHYRRIFSRALFRGKSWDGPIQ